MSGAARCRPLSSLPSGSERTHRAQDLEGSGCTGLGLSRTGSLRPVLTVLGLVLYSSLCCVCTCALSVQNGLWVCFRGAVHVGGWGVRHEGL